MHFRFSEGQRVIKPAGYPFPGIVQTAFTNSRGEERYVVEFVGNDGLGEPTLLMHIFNADQLEDDNRFDSDGVLVDEDDEELVEDELAELEGRK